MTMSRRPVLQGLAATGLAAVVPDIPGANASPSKGLDKKQPDAALPWIIVLASGPFDDALLASIAQTNVPDADVTVLHIPDLGSPDLPRLQAMLTAGRRQILAGLIEDGLAAIVVESARTAGARLRWLGQHTLTPTEIRHRLLTASEGYAARFAEALTACGSRFSMSHHDLSAGTMAHLAASSPIPSAPDAGFDHWAVALGQIIATINGLDPLSAGKGSLEAAAGRPEPISSGPAESLVSFSFEL